MMSDDGSVRSGSLVASALCRAANAGDSAKLIANMRLPNTDVNATTERGTTALHVASRSGSVECVTALMDAGARVDVTDAENWTPLHYACLYGHEAVCELLLKGGASIVARTSQGATPLHHACHNAHKRIASLLIQRGADISQHNQVGSPLHHFAINDTVELPVKNPDPVGVALWKKMPFTDVVFKISGTEIPAHKCIMCKSQFFVDLFSHNPTQTVFDLNNMKSEVVFRYILEWVYTGALQIFSPVNSMEMSDTDLVLALITASNLLNLEDLKIACTIFLWSKMSASLCKKAFPVVLESPSSFPLLLTCLATFSLRNPKELGAKLLFPIQAQIIAELLLPSLPVNTSRPRNSPSVAVQSATQKAAALHSHLLSTQTPPTAPTPSSSPKPASTSSSTQQSTSTSITTSKTTLATQPPAASKSPAPSKSAAPSKPVAPSKPATPPKNTKKATTPVKQATPSGPPPGFLHDQSTLTITIPPNLRPKLEGANFKHCKCLFNAIKKNRYAVVFLEPVDPIKDNAKDYFDKIKTPMDLGTVKKRLFELDVYHHQSEFLSDVQLIWSNAMTYNEEESDIYGYATALQESWIKKVDATVWEFLPGLHPKFLEATGAPPPITDEYKRTIFDDLLKMTPTQVSRILEIFGHSYKDPNPIRICLNEVPEAKLRDLKNYTQACLEEKIAGRKRQNKRT
ncbi:ankyrin repeat domain-containing protein 11/12 [Pelomyxa schiedti]|nr:ankyrin repeat domain-containing protein 11/12 [Pelomyxa schiedti]